MHKVDIGFQELQAVALMLCKMAFWVSGIVVALHLNNSTAKAYSCNKGHTASTILSSLAWQV